MKPDFTDTALSDSFNWEQRMSVKPAFTVYVYGLHMGNQETIKLGF